MFQIWLAANRPVDEWLKAKFLRRYPARRRNDKWRKCVHKQTRRPGPSNGRDLAGDVPWVFLFRALALVADV